MKFEDIINQVRTERMRQNLKWGQKRDLPDRTWIVVLLEEVGEIAHASLEHDIINLKEEIIQVIAVCFAWLENNF